ncbi:hypothetical protein [Streptomyces sclerotialus]
MAKELGFPPDNVRKLQAIYAQQRHLTGELYTTAVADPKKNVF